MIMLSMLIRERLHYQKRFIRKRLLNI